jgi:hypothetical protein
MNTLMVNRTFVHVLQNQLDNHTILDGHSFSGIDFPYADKEHNNDRPILKSVTSPHILI